MKTIPLLSFSNFARWSEPTMKPWHKKYLAMYSSVFGGIVTDPRLMLVPMDDHLVHRGDGVFETFKCVSGALYNMAAHLDRLCSSAEAIALKLPMSKEELAETVVQTVRVGGQRNCLVRVLLSRGPGSMGVSPYECPESAVYIMVSEFHKPFMELHPEGARARTSRMPVKEAPFSGIKSANYLINVLMKKEAVDSGVDFVIGFDENGFMAEGPTENAGIVTQSGKLLVPKLERILAGTTMLKVLELARRHRNDIHLAAAEHANITHEDISEAAEMLILGTTPDVASVVEFDGTAVGDGKPGPIAAALGKVLRNDMLYNPDVLVRVF